MQTPWPEHLASRLYDGVLEPEAWFGALDQLRAQLQAAVFHYFTLDDAGGAVPDSAGNVESFGLNAGHMVEYETLHAPHDLRLAATLRTPQGAVMFDHENIGMRALSRNPVYADWLVPLGLRHTAGSMVRHEGSARDFISFMRPRDAGPFADADRQLLSSVLPHLARAARLRARAGQLSHKAALGLSALDTLPQGVLVVDASRRVHYGNAAAERLLAADGAALNVHHGLLGCAAGDGHARLVHLVSTACVPAGQGGAFTVAHGQGADKAAAPAPLSVQVMPLRAHPALAAAQPARRALLLLTMPAGVRSQEAEALVETLGLSPTEARLALLLAAGKTVKDFAAIEGCSWHTARTHARNLLRRTGLHRQTEVAQLVRSLQGR